MDYIKDKLIIQLSKITSIETNILNNSIKEIIFQVSKFNTEMRFHKFTKTIETNILKNSIKEIIFQVSKVNTEMRFHKYTKTIETNILKNILIIEIRVYKDNFILRKINIQGINNH